MKNPYFALPDLMRRYLKRLAEQEGINPRINPNAFSRAVENTEYYKKYLVSKNGAKISNQITLRLGNIMTEKGEDHSKIKILLSDLMVCNELFDDEYKLTNIPILTYGVNLLNIFTLEDKIDFFAPAVWNEEVGSLVSNVFHTRTFEVLQDTKELPPFVKYNHVIRRERKLSDYTNTLWYQSLNDNSHHVRIACSHNYHNAAVEIILAEKVFNVMPFYPVKINMERKDWLPFHTYFPDVNDQEKSAFNLPMSMLKKHLPDDAPNMIDKRCIIVNGKPYISDNRKDFPELTEHTNYGALILKTNKPPKNINATSILYGTIFATTAPVNLAIADRLLTGNKPVPFILPRIKSIKEDHVLIVVVKVTVGVNDQLLEKYGSVEKLANNVKHEEWRTVKKIKIVDAVLSVFDEKNQVWEAKETLENSYSNLDDDSDEQWYIKSLDDSEETEPTYLC